MKAIPYEQYTSTMWLNSCAYCGAPLLEDEGVKAVVAGVQELFCDGECIGQYWQQQTIAFR
jgi:hypothetical protein